MKICVEFKLHLFNSIPTSNNMPQTYCSNKENFELSALTYASKCISLKWGKDNPICCVTKSEID